MKGAGSMRRDLKIKKLIDALGCAMALLGLGGIGGACEGEGFPIVAVLVFSIGFGICLWGIRR